MREKYPGLIITIFVTLFCGVSLSFSQTADLKLTDVTQQVGISFRHNIGDDEMSNLIESNAAGCAFFDYDNDGDLDIYLVNGAYNKTISHIQGRINKGNLFNALYRNNGDMTFTEVTIKAGVGHEGMGMAVVTADYDNDGDQDIFVSNWGPNVFYRNNGDGTFTDITLKAGLENNLYGIGTTFLDYDQDGFLDLYVGNYIEFDPEYQYYYAADKFPGPLSYHGQPDILYHNNGNGTFSDVTKNAGVYNPDGRAMGVTSCDFDDDGDWDIFVANDAMENYLYRNNGDGTGFSRMYRKGGRYGPFWFDYNDVSKEPMWRDLVGYYTRYGDVRELLLEPDSKYAITNAGDEITLEFDATRVTDLPPGWTRDFIIYTNGWLKDGDLNTALGQTVDPLPFIGMSRYPYGSDESYPKDEDHQLYLKKYHTRKVTTAKLHDLILNNKFND